MNTVLETTNNGPPGLSFDPPNWSHRKQARQTAARDRPDDPGILFGILIRLILRIYLEEWRENTGISYGISWINLSTASTPVIVNIMAGWSRWSTDASAKR